MWISCQQWITTTGYIFILNFLSVFISLFMSATPQSELLTNSHHVAWFQLPRQGLVSKQRSFTEGRKKNVKYLQEQTVVLDQLMCKQGDEQNLAILLYFHNRLGANRTWQAQNNTHTHAYRNFLRMCRDEVCMLCAGALVGWCLFQDRPCFELKRRRRPLIFFLVYLIGVVP